jgi:hypothetical protein
MRYSNEHLEEAVAYTLKLMKNKDYSGLEHHKRWVSDHGVEFRRAHDKLRKERQHV